MARLRGLGLCLAVASALAMVGLMYLLLTTEEDAMLPGLATPGRLYTLPEGGLQATAAANEAEGGTRHVRAEPVRLPELRIFFVTIVGTEEPVTMLDVQLRHFHALGIPYERMGVVFHVVPREGADYGKAPYLEDGRAIVARYPGVQSRVWLEPFIDNVKVSQLKQMLWQLDFNKDDLHHSATPTPGATHDWVVYADSDELHQYVELDPTAAAAAAAAHPAVALGAASGPLPRLVAYLSAHNVSGIEGRFLDRVGDDGALVKLDPARSPFEQYPYGCDITGAVVRGTPTKLMAWRPVKLRMGDGGFHEHDTAQIHNHGVRILPPAVGGWVHHFKWVAGIVEETRARLADFQRRNFSYVAEVSSLVKYFDATKNRIDVTPGKTSNCVRCTGPGGLIGPSDGDRYLTPLTDDNRERRVMTIYVKPRAV